MTAGLLIAFAAVLAGAFLIFVTRCVTPTDAYREIEWRVVILIACMLALGLLPSASEPRSYHAGPNASSSRPMIAMPKLGWST